MAAIAPVCALAVSQLTHRLGPWARGRAAGPEALPALALAIGLVATPVSVISNARSRGVEARADAFALELTDAPGPFMSFERRIALQNLADPDPPAWVAKLLGTHPTTVQRMGIARAYQEGARLGGAPAPPQPRPTPPPQPR
jgi:STE24 endopeptidase